MSTTEPDLPAEGGRPRGGRRRGDDRFPRGPKRWVAFGIAIALVLGFATIAAISQTRWGRDQVLAYTLTALGGRLNGQLTIADLDGNLITGARLYEIALRDPDGTPLALIDSAYVRYQVATFLGGDVVITRLEAYQADINIFRMPGDTLWNYQRILQDPTPGPGGDPRATLIERLIAHDAHVVITMPVEPDERLSEARQAEELEMMLADTARYAIEQVPGGYLQTNTVDVADAEVTELYIGGEERGGLYVEVVDAVAEVRLWLEPPLEVRGVTAQLHLNEGVLNYEAPRVVLPNSTGASVGRIDLTGDRPLYDIFIASDQFALADLRFLYPWLPDDPEEGTGEARLWVEDREDGLLVLARDLELRMPGTRLVGSFGIITDAATEGLRFVDVELEAEPLRVESVEQLLPEDLPVEGLVIGGATIQGTS